MGGIAPLCAIDWRLTEPGQVQPGEVACIGKWREQAGLKLGRRQVQETMSQAVAESGMDSFPERTIEARAIRTGNLANVEMALRREEKIEWHRLGVRTYYTGDARSGERPPINSVCSMNSVPGRDKMQGVQRYASQGGKTRRSRMVSLHLDSCMLAVRFLLSRQLIDLIARIACRANAIRRLAF